MYIRAISPMVSNLQTHTEQFRTCASFNHMMAANAGVIKAIVTFYRVNSVRAFERHIKIRIPIIDLNTVHALKKHLIQFLGPKELTIKYGL